MPSSAPSWRKHDDRDHAPFAAARKIRSPDRKRQRKCRPLGHGRRFILATRPLSKERSKRLRQASSSQFLSGREDKIKSVAKTFSLDLGGIEIIDVPHSQAAAEKAVELIRSGKAELLMKGSLHTDELLAEVVKRETGIRTGRRISHVFVMDVPGHPHTLFITDAAVNIAPDLAAKHDIIQNAIDLHVGLGLGTPKVAILSAVETVTSSIPSTIEAAALCKMADRGQITDGVLDGPLAFDNAISPEAARIKGIKSPVAGQAQILVVPDLEAGNMLAKNLDLPVARRCRGRRARRKSADHSHLAGG